MAQETPFTELAGAEFHLISRSQNRIHFTIKTPSQASCVHFWEEDSKDFRETYINGKKVEPLLRLISDLDERWVKPKAIFQLDRWHFRYCGIPAKGIEVELVTSEPGPFSFRLVDTSWKLPPIPQGETLTYPTGFMPQYWSNRLLVSKKILVR